MFVGFISDNAAGVHPRILDAVVRANSGYCPAYGEDDYCRQAQAEFRRLFGGDIEVFLALSGTGCNVLSLRSALRPWQAVICSDVAHINMDESGAPEWGAGSKLLAVPSVNGKISPDSLDIYLPDIKDCHHATPHLLSITQTTEKGAVYTPEEIRALADKAHANGLLVHMDGTRLANAVAALEPRGVNLRALTRDAGVDLLSFGGTKNGLMLGEAVVFFRPELAEDFRTMRKQSLQLVSKMRFVAVQFIEALRDGLWLENARHANKMARLLADGLAGVPYMTVREPEANAVFVRMEPERMARLLQDFDFHETDSASHEARLMCSFATTEEEVAAFVRAARALI
ncbi:MAG: threonine aldolase [Desulfovibrionaceae bacterium]|nr:threonine aldolase [Desulfovibrionaceae bacterium]